MKKPSTNMITMNAVGAISKWKGISPLIPRTTDSVGEIVRMRVAIAETAKVQYNTVRAPIRSDSTPPCKRERC